MPVTVIFPKVASFLETPHLPVTENEPIFSVSSSPNSTEITKLVLNQHFNMSMFFAMTSKVRKKRKNFKINRKAGRFSKNTKKAEDLPLYQKTWQVCRYDLQVSTSSTSIPGK